MRGRRRLGSRPPGRRTSDVPIAEVAIACCTRPSTSCSMTLDNKMTTPDLWPNMLPRGWLDSYVQRLLTLLRALGCDGATPGQEWCSTFWRLAGTVGQRESALSRPYTCRCTTSRLCVVLCVCMCVCSRVKMEDADPRGAVVVGTWSHGCSRHPCWGHGTPLVGPAAPGSRPAAPCICQSHYLARSSSGAVLTFGAHNAKGSSQGQTACSIHAVVSPPYGGDSCHCCKPNVQAKEETPSACLVHV